MAGKGAAVLAFLALIIGAGGLGLGLYMFIFPADALEEKGVQNVWFESVTADFHTDPILTDIVIDDLEIEFTVESSQHGNYFQFCCNAHLAETATSYIALSFYLDEQPLRAGGEPWYTILTENDELLTSVTLQHYTTGLAQGDHTITVVIEGNNVDNYVSDCSLLVQTII